MHYSYEGIGYGQGVFMFLSLNNDVVLLEKGTFHSISHVYKLTLMF